MEIYGVSFLFCDYGLQIIVCDLREREMNGPIFGFFTVLFFSVFSFFFFLDAVHGGGEN